MEEKKKNETDYKQNCRFYDKKRKRCIALKEVYCDIEENMCVFYKERRVTKND